MASEIEQLRVQIDALDRQILEMISRRAALALEVGRAKSKAGQALYDPEREAAILEDRARQALPPLPGLDAARIFRTIMDVCLRLQLDNNRAAASGGQPGDGSAP